MFYIYSILGLLLALHGLNNSTIYYTAISIVISLKIITGQFSYTHIIHLLISIIIFFLFPSYTVLYGFLALVFFDTKQPYISSSFIVLWILELCGLSLVTYASIAIAYTIGILISFTYYTKHIYRLGSIICITLTLSNILSSEGPISIENLDPPSIYAPGEVLGKNTGSKLEDYTSDSKALIRCYSFPIKSPRNLPGVLTFDVDYKGGDPLVSSHTWSQPTPWNKNIFLGNQYWIEAIRQDGALYSNKGITLKSSGKIMLAFPDGLFHSTPLAIFDNKTLLLHDSDYTSSFISNYQVALDSEIVQSLERACLVRVINILFLLTTLVIGWTQPHTTSTRIILTTISGALLICLAVPEIKSQTGDIRMVGKIQDSHENYRADGSLKTIVAAGFPYTLGDSNCTVLIVKENETTQWKGEKIIIAEPQVSIKIGPHTYTTGSLPLGYKSGIPDAREWLRDGHRVGAGYIKTNNIIMISTGSPATLPWASIIK